MLTRSIVLFNLFLLAACDGNSSGNLPPQRVTISAARPQSFIILKIEEVEILSNRGELMGEREFRLIVVGSDQSGNYNSLTCPAHEPLLVSVGEKVQPCSFGLAIAEEDIEGDLVFLILGVDEDQVNRATGFSIDFLVNLLARGVVGVIKGGLIIGGIIAAGPASPAVIGGEILLETAVGYAGGELIDYGLEEDEIGVQALRLQSQHNWFAGQRHNVVTGDGHLRLVFSIHKTDAPGANTIPFELTPSSRSAPPAEETTAIPTVSNAVPTSTDQPATPRPAPTVAPSTGGSVGINGLIVFDSTRDGGLEGPPEIYVMNADGSNQRRLTNSSDYDDEPDLSRDGEWIVYESKTGQASWRLKMIRVDGSNERTLWEGGRQPAWSPDGRYVAYETTGFPQQIWIIDAASGSTWQLTHNDRDNRTPSWSPDGRQIVFMSKIGGYWQLFIADVDSGREQQITFDPVHSRFPAWSPDGRLIAYNTAPDDQSLPDYIWVIEPTGGGQRRLTTTGNSGRAAWSPDSQYVLFNSRQGSRWLIARIDRDGQNWVWLTSAGHDQRADWER